MIFFLVFVVILLLTFAFVDVWYILRFFAMYCFGTRRRQTAPLSLEDITKPYSTTSIVLPSDIDPFLHMNNAKYMKEFDMARIYVSSRLGLFQAMQKRGGYCAMTSSSIKYRRPMKLFQRFTVQTNIIGWEKDSLYMEQRTITPNNNFVTSILYTKYAVRGVTVDQCLIDICGENLQSPGLSKEVSAWIESLEMTSKKLRQEAGLVRSNSTRELTASSLKR